MGYLTFCIGYSVKVHSNCSNAAKVLKLSSQVFKYLSTKYSKVLTDTRFINHCWNVNYSDQLSVKKYLS